jgi:hypothetical protein
MKILTDLRFYVVVATLSLTGLLVNYFNKLDDLEKTKEELLKCQTDKGYIPGGDIEKSLIINERDSLRDELFIRFVEVSRYETALEIFKEQNQKSADEFELILTTQTE